MEPVGTQDVNDIENKQNIGEIMAKAIVGIATEKELGEIKNLIQEGVGEKGGLTVPDDVKTKIIELQRKAFDIRKYVDIEPTKSTKG
ncbi:phage major capsid protein [Vallitalea guaymasensis]|uniref:phage major capsid protein n=1 Tax=Vallitalea guaymasensis TaxID=1185412 RepID=UPI001FA85652|nr:phage major capsid protein [Vallitalea guaymasensis]